MKKLTLAIIIVVLLFSLISTSTAVSYTNVSVSEAKAMIDSNLSLMVLDVRTLSEYNSGHIRNTKHIPLAELGGRLGELDLNDEILVYCGSGGRSARASQLLVDNGFTHIYNMLGGITAWIGAGYPVYVKYSSIQEAINTASEGATIYVSSGRYFENVLVNKSVSLLGENMYNTIIDGTLKPYAVNVTADKVNISSFNIRNAGPYSARWSSGIYVYSSHNNISHNIILNNTDSGINLEFSSNNTITHNHIYLNQFMGMQVYSSTNNTISYNHIFLNQDSGLWLITSQNNTITSNNVTSNRWMGIWLMGGTYCTISNNTIFNNTHGIYLSYSNHNLVSHNTVSHPSPPDSGWGLYMGTASNCTVLKNDISNHDSGIFLGWESNSNTISYNTVSDCSRGLSLVSHVENNSILINTFSRTERVLELLDSSHSNMLVWNNFVEYDDVLIGNDPPNFWDNGRWGNYWSNYNGSDLDSDGVGDTDIPWEGVDNYPLMNFFWNIGDVDHDFDVDIFDVVKAAGIYGCTSLDPNWNPHCDIAEPYGIIDIFDLVMIAGSYGEEYSP